MYFEWMLYSCLIHWLVNLAATPLKTIWRRWIKYVSLVHVSWSKLLLWMMADKNSSNVTRDNIFNRQTCENIFRSAQNNGEAENLFRCFYLYRYWCQYFPLRIKVSQVLYHYYYYHRNSSFGILSIFYLYYNIYILQYDTIIEKISNTLTWQHNWSNTQYGLYWKSIWNNSTSSFDIIFSRT